MSEPLHVEVLYALPDTQTLISLCVPAGTTVMQAIERSRILESHPEIDFARNKLGVYGKLTKGDAILRDRDRVEIYRPLIADPKEVRRKRAEEGKVTRKGGGTAEG